MHYSEWLVFKIVLNFSKNRSRLIWVEENGTDLENVMEDIFARADTKIDSLKVYAYQKFDSKIFKILIRMIL